MNKEEFSQLLEAPSVILEVDAERFLRDGTLAMWQSEQGGVMELHRREGALFVVCAEKGEEARLVMSGPTISLEALFPDPGATKLYPERTRKDFAQFLKRIGFPAQYADYNDTARPIGVGEFRVGTFDSDGAFKSARSPSRRSGDKRSYSGDDVCGMCCRKIEHCACRSCPDCGHIGDASCYHDERDGGHGMPEEVSQMLGQVAFLREKFSGELDVIRKNCREAIRDDVQGDDIVKQKIRKLNNRGGLLRRRLAKLDHCESLLDEARGAGMVYVSDMRSQADEVKDVLACMFESHGDVEQCVSDQVVQKAPSRQTVLSNSM